MVTVSEVSKSIHLDDLVEFLLDGIVVLTIGSVMLTGVAYLYYHELKVDYEYKTYKCYMINS